jgi:hypothetical protein
VCAPGRRDLNDLHMEGGVCCAAQIKLHVACSSISSGYYFTQYELSEKENLVENFEADNTDIAGHYSSVSTATSYGMDGPGIESRRGRDILHPFRPALGPTQPQL